MSLSPTPLALQPDLPAPPATPGLRRRIVLVAMAAALLLPAAAVWRVTASAPLVPSASSRETVEPVAESSAPAETAPRPGCRRPAVVPAEAPYDGEEAGPAAAP